MNIREPRNECGFDTGSGQKAPGFFFALMPVGRLAKILPSMVRIIKVEGGKQPEKSDAQLQLYTGRAEINLGGPSPFLIV